MLQLPVDHSVAQLFPASGALPYQFRQSPRFGSCLKVAPGLWWLRMPLPFALNHINLWLFEEDDGWTLFDCGIATEPVKTMWKSLFASFLRERPLKRIIVSHSHPDHIGLGSWLCERYGGEIWMSETEYRAADAIREGRPGWKRHDSEQFLRCCGVPEERVSLGAQCHMQYRQWVPALPIDYQQLEQGMSFAIAGRHWQVLMARGHAPNQVCLYCEELDILVSGDQILAQITSNVSVWPDDLNADPLRLYLESLEDFKVLPRETLVLPSHGRPFFGLHERLAELAKHHEIRLTQLQSACCNPRSVAELLPVLFERSLDDQQLHFAVGEALAHLNHLCFRGEMVCRTGRDQVWLFSTGIKRVVAD